MNADDIKSKMEEFKTLMNNLTFEQVKNAVNVMTEDQFNMIKAQMVSELQGVTKGTE